MIDQAKHAEWCYQWERFEDNAPFLFSEWICPRTLDDFRGKHVFDAGCGPGHHVRLVATAAQHVTGMDLNTSQIAASILENLNNVTILAGDIATYRPQETYEVVYCIGVIHHTDNPDITFDNLRQMCSQGGLLIIWCYSAEGNAIVSHIIEPIRRLFLRHQSRDIIRVLAWILTALLYPFIYTIYLLPLHRLPYYEYFQNFRRLSFKRNMLNIFDKLNAPQTKFISREQVEKWFNLADFDDISITPYKNVSWRASGIVKRG